MDRRQVLKSSVKVAVGIGALPGLSVLLKSCGVERFSDYHPSYLTINQFDTVWKISDLMLPQTESPGASDAGVAPYIDLLFSSYFKEDTKSKLESGLTTFITNCQEQYGTLFTSLDENKQTEYLRKTERDQDGKLFFKSLKGIIMWAYFTSEAGMKSMNYVPVPGKYDGCIEIDENEKILVGNG